MAVRAFIHRGWKYLRPLRMPTTPSIYRYQPNEELYERLHFGSVKSGHQCEISHEFTSHLVALAKISSALLPSFSDPRDIRILCSPHLGRHPFRLWRARPFADDERLDRGRRATKTRIGGGDSVPERVIQALLGNEPLYALREPGDALTRSSSDP